MLLNVTHNMRGEGKKFSAREGMKILSFSQHPLSNPLSFSHASKSIAQGMILNVYFSFSRNKASSEREKSGWLVCCMGEEKKGIRKKGRKIDFYETRSFVFVARD
jgi:hypothetical protein